MVLAQRERARIRRVPSDVWSRRIALEREEHVDLRVLGECLRSSRIDRASVSVESEKTLLRVLQGAADIEHVLEHEVARVDERTSTVFCQDRERCQHRAGEGFGDGACFHGVARGAEAKIAADEEETRT